MILHPVISYYIISCYMILYCTIYHCTVQDFPFLYSVILFTQTRDMRAVWTSGLAEDSFLSKEPILPWQPSYLHVGFLGRHDYRYYRDQGTPSYDVGFGRWGFSGHGPRGSTIRSTTRRTAAACSRSVHVDVTWPGSFQLLPAVSASRIPGPGSWA